MRKTFFPLFCSLIVVLVILSACNMPTNSATETAPQPLEQITDTPVVIETTATQTEIPFTETPTVIPTDTPIPQPTDTVTPEPVFAKVGRESNCRIGPGSLYDLVVTYQEGQNLQVIAKDLGGGYWFVQNPDKPEEQCYILANSIKISGDTSSLAQITPLPSPTSSPYFVAAFKKFDSCNGKDYAIFTVDNKGSFAFRSAYIKVTDLKVNKSVEQALNAFDQRSHCTLVKNIAPLEVGGSGYVTSAPFEWKATSNKLRAAIMLCTEKNLKGSCVSQVVNINQ